MATTLATPGTDLMDTETPAVSPKTGALTLGSGMLCLVAVASAWTIVMVGLHFLELHFLMN